MIEESIYTAVSAEHVSAFLAMLAEDRVLQDATSLQRCASDHTEDLQYLPELVVQPVNTEEVAKVVRYCHDQYIPLTVRGAGTGLSGGCLPVKAGVVLDMRRMNKILNLDTLNFQVTVEPGMITEELQNAVAEKGLFYPVDPASRGSCFIGGNIAENSGGPRALKYGVTKDYVLNLEIVLPTGEIIWTGANTLKNATGYNLTQLIVGSEGTLAVVTKIVLKLIPLPTQKLLLLVPFTSALDAVSAVNKIFLAGLTPSALEFMERDAIVLAQEYLQHFALPLPETIQAHLLIEVDGNHTEQLFRELEQINDIVAAFDIGEVLFAETSEQQSELWRLRRVIGEAVKSRSAYKEEDTVVPRAHLPQLLARVKVLGAAYGFSSVCYGHAGDGNLHVNILKGDLTDFEWKVALPKAIRELFTYVKELGGTLSGEHGIGLVQQAYMDIVFPEAGLQLMSAIKRVFDPRLVLNPGKILPSSTPAIIP